jgi:predicted nucleic acid-binding protein
MTVYLDNCCFNRPYDDQRPVLVRIEAEAKLFVQDQIRQRALDLVWSYVLDFENSRNPFLERRVEITRWRALATTAVAPSEGILHRGESLQTTGLKAMDALHLACAIEARCGYFLTVDRGILNRAAMIPDLIVCSPVGFLERIQEV